MPTIHHLSPRWPLCEQQKFLTRFSQLIEQGFSLAQALEIMGTLFKQEAIAPFAAHCANGQPFASTLKTCHFEKRIVYIVRCGEEAGSLLQGLQKAAEYSEHLIQNKAELSKKLRYPLFLFTLMIGILGIVYLFFFPQLEDFYQSFHIEGDPTLLNGVLLLLGGLLLLIFLLIGSFFLILTSPHRCIPHLLFHFPLLKSLSQHVFSYYFSSQWLIFLNCGLPLKESLFMMRSFENIPFVRHIIDELQQRLEKGISLGDLFEKSPYFTAYFKLIMKHALQLAKVHQELKTYSTEEFKRLTQHMNTLFKTIQFIFLALIGLIIVLIYLSLLQPVFQMAELI